VPEIVYYVAQSVDGFIATTEGGLDWLAPFEASGEDYDYAAFYDSVDAVLLGSRTYEQALTFAEWPYPDRPVYVFSSRALAPAGANVVVTSMSPEHITAELGERGVRRAWLVGGGALAAAFQRAGLITEYVVSTIPVVLGDGVRLLGTQGSSQRLVLVSTTRYDDGVLQQVYRPAEPA